MLDMPDARDRMVERQVARRGVQDRHVLEAMRKRREYAHAANAALTLVGFGLVVAGVLVAKAQAGGLGALGSTPRARHRWNRWRPIGLILAGKKGSWAGDAP